VNYGQLQVWLVCWSLVFMELANSFMWAAGPSRRMEMQRGKSVVRKVNCVTSVLAWSSIKDICVPWSLHVHSATHNCLRKELWLFCAWMKTCPAITLKERNFELMLPTSNAPCLHARLQLAQAFASTNHVCFLWLLPRLERICWRTCYSLFAWKELCAYKGQLWKEFLSWFGTSCLHVFAGLWKEIESSKSAWARFSTRPSAASMDRLCLSGEKLCRFYIETTIFS